jgi:hypothetical protein
MRRRPPRGGGNSLGFFEFQEGHSRSGSHHFSRLRPLDIFFKSTAAAPLKILGPFLIPSPPGALQAWQDWAVEARKPMLLKGGCGYANF